MLHERPTEYYGSSTTLFSIKPYYRTRCNLLPYTRLKISYVSYSSTQITVLASPQPLHITRLCPFDARMDARHLLALCVNAQACSHRLTPSRHSTVGSGQLYDLAILM